MEKRKFIHLPAADRHMLTDLLVQAGFIDQQGYVTKAGEEIISGEAYGGLLADANLLGTDIKLGYVRLVYRLSPRWVSANTKAPEAQASMVGLGFNMDIAAKAVVYIYDQDMHAEDALLMMADIEEVQSE